MPILALGIALAPLGVVHPIRVHGRSMEPTLRNGQIAWVLRSWVAGTPTQGQVWLIQREESASLKRVLALPGEHLEMREGDLFRAGQRLSEPYLQHLERNSAGPWDAGSGYLVLGDNRPESQDSRLWGPVPLNAFKGRILGLPF